MDWAIKIGYAVMVFAIIMCFIFSKRGEKEMRHMVDRFAQAFCKLSNYVLPGGKAPAATLAARKKDGVMQALPAAEQPEELQKLKTSVIQSVKNSGAQTLANYIQTIYYNIYQKQPPKKPPLFHLPSSLTALARRK